MLEKIAKIAERYDELERRMADPEVLADYQKIKTLSQERSELQPIVDSYRKYLDVSKDLEETHEL